MRVPLKVSFVEDSNILSIVVLDGESEQGRVYRKLFVSFIILLRKTGLIAAKMETERLEVKENIKMLVEV